mgnify:CR=1 FL=1
MGKREQERKKGRRGNRKGGGIRKGGKGKEGTVANILEQGRQKTSKGPVSKQLESNMNSA